MLTYDDVPRAFNLASYFVDRNVEEGRGARTALIGPGGATTYAELAALTNRSGNVLRELGVRAEERVLLVLADSVEFVALWYGAQKIGAVTAEAYTFLPPKDFAYYLDYTRASVVVADTTTLERVREAAASSPWLRQVLVVGPPAELSLREASFDALAAAAPDELEPAPTTRDDIAIWKFTTGSTGLPKAAVHPQHSPLLSFDWYARGVLGIREDDVVLPVPKLFFGYARDLTALYPFGVGAAGIVFPERTTPERVFELVARHRPSILVHVPTMMAAMVAHPGAAHQDLSSLRLCTSAGEALPRELYERWRATFGVEVLDGIGSSEAYHIYISNRPGRVRAGSVGEVVPGYRARVLDEDGQEVPDGEVGTLWIEGDTAALLYWNDHEKTKQTFSGDLVKTGDLFVRDPEGFFWYRGRSDELIKVGGIWVAPAEIEQCLISHPDVAECAVVGHEHEGLTVTRAHVVLRQGLVGSQELAAALQEHVRSRLSPHKYPRDVLFVAELPKTPSGKIDRRALRAELEAVGR
jgi:benzoate-CoA ligase family protein